MTMQSGFMASSVRAVSNKDSPFFRLEDSACRFMVSAPSREAAVAKLMRVRVEASKKASPIVLPRRVASFFSGWRWNSWKGLDSSRRKAICSAVNSSMLSRSRKRSATSTPRGYLLCASIRNIAGGPLFDALHEHDTLFLVGFLQPDFDDLPVAGLDRPAYETGLDREFAMPSVDQHHHAHA